MSKNINNIAISNWYPTLADYTLPATFVKLKEKELKLIANKVEKGSAVESIISRIKQAKSSFSRKVFVSADILTPTDTDKFKIKKGAIYSAKSIWKNLINSLKVRTAAKNESFEFICIRPFRNFTYPREFRLFIYNRELKLMSQYWQTRHYHRLLIQKNFFWMKAKELIEEIAWLLPNNNIVLDIYFTSKNRIILIDFNVWEEPTKPLLARTWNLDWNKIYGIKIL